MLPGVNNQTGLHRRGNTTPGQGASAKSLARSPGVQAQARVAVVRTAPRDDSAIAFSSSPLHKLDPDAFGLPDGFHFGARLGLVHAEYVAAKAIEERRDPSVGDAVHVHRGIL